MPKFYFHLLDDMDTFYDEGMELADLAAARDVVLNEARRLMCETMTKDGRITLHHRIDILDEGRAVVGSVRFGDAVRVEE
jgi:hypothetical protein